MIGGNKSRLGAWQQFPFHRLFVVFSYRKVLCNKLILNNIKLLALLFQEKLATGNRGGFVSLEGSQLRNDVSKTGFEDGYLDCWIADRRHVPGPTGRVKVQNSSNLTGTVSLPERTFPASSVV